MGTLPRIGCPNGAPREPWDIAAAGPVPAGVVSTGRTPGWGNTVILFTFRWLSGVSGKPIRSASPGAVVLPFPLGFHKYLLL